MFAKARAPLMVGIAAACLSTARADVPSEAAHSDVRAELSKIVRSDLARTDNAAPKVAAGVPGSVAAEAPTVMSSYVVREAKPMQPITLAPETPIVRLLKDGVLFDPAGGGFGPLVKLHFYTVEANGVGSIRPRNGVQLAATWAW